MPGHIGETLVVLLSIGVLVALAMLWIAWRETH
jgi:hypothetical protein